METSDTISELITALAKAQGEFTAVPKTRENPFLHNRYATLDGVIDTIRGPLSQNELAFIQPLTDVEGVFWLETRLMHSSGEWIATAAAIPEWKGTGSVNALQSFGGALTYMRRYMLTSMLGINAEEDGDGNGSKPGQASKKQPTAAKKKSVPRATKKPVAGHSEPAKDSGISLTTEQMQALLDNKLADGPPNAAHMINLSGLLDKASTTEEIVAWAKLYRAARDEGAEPQDAAKRADVQAALEVAAEAGDG